MKASISNEFNDGAHSHPCDATVGSCRDMKRLFAAPAVAVALLLGACSGGGYGTVGPPDLTGANGNPGGGTVTPPSAGTAGLPEASLMPLVRITR